jgi:hypothetical protein
VSNITVSTRDSVIVGSQHVCCLHVRRHNVLFIEISEVQEENILPTEIFIIATLMDVDMLRLGFASTKLQYP